MASHTNPALEVQNLVKRFGDLTAVDGLSLQIRQGEIFGFLGPNGAGKTTSIRMMCGLLKPTSGEVLLDGQRLDEANGTNSRSRVGICPQENILWTKLTCFEQLVFSARMYDVPGQVARERAQSLLASMGLEEKKNKLAGTLSGGMKRRMNIILALMHDPSILVFDEPEAGLDPQSRILVREFIRDTAREKTVIVTTHNMDEADRLTDRVGIIDRGKLLKLDTPLALKKSIGEGDILEITAVAERSGQLDVAVQNLCSALFEARGEGDRILIRARNLVPRIPEIYSILGSSGVKVAAMNLRENTLEDVFIHLTGKSLRS